MIHQNLACMRHRYMFGANQNWGDFSSGNTSLIRHATELQVQEEERKNKIEHPVCPHVHLEGDVAALLRDWALYADVPYGDWKWNSSDLAPLRERLSSLSRVGPLLPLLMPSAATTTAASASSDSGVSTHERVHERVHERPGARARAKEGTENRGHGCPLLDELTQWSAEFNRPRLDFVR